MNERTRTELTVARERAVLAAVLTPGNRSDPFNPLGELKALVEAAGGEVVDGVLQKRAQLCAATGVGKGKLDELQRRCDESQATVIIFDNELSPSQIRNIEEATGRKTLDRSEVILDIFARRARTHEAKLQVELAQLEYTAPRLRGMWTHLERIAGAGGATGAGAVGGIGTRGPGERQIEIDRRIVSDRIASLKREIAEIGRRKEREVRSRGDEFTVSLVGYTNSGKSTLMNACTGAGRRAEDALFVTLDTKTARWSLGDGRTALLSDTVGFIRDLPHHLVASFRATLEETVHAGLLLHVVDASSPMALEQVRAVEGVLAELGCQERPTLVLLNKMDVVRDLSIVSALENRLRDTIRLSARTGDGMDRLVQEVIAIMDRTSVKTRLRLPVTDGRLLAEVNQAGRVSERRYDGEHVEIALQLPSARLEQLRRRYPNLQELVQPHV